MKEVCKLGSKGVYSQEWRARRGDFPSNTKGMEKLEETFENFVIKGGR